MCRGSNWSLWGNNWRRGNKSLKLLVIAAVACAISIQFKSAVRTLQAPATHYHDFVPGPPGARRWEGNKTLANSIRGDSAPIADQPNATTYTMKPDESKQKMNRKQTSTAQKHQPDELTTKEDKLIPEKRKETSPSRRVPRDIVIEYKSGKIFARPQSAAHQSTVFNETSMPTDGPQIQPTWYDPNADDFIDGYDRSVCVPMYDWQLQSYPNCNRFHELDLPHMRVINSGGSRIAFELRQHLDGSELKFVYKTVKYSRDIHMQRVEEQRKDAMVMERATSSQFIPDIHGYCSVGVMMDFMPEGNMHDYIKGARLAGGSTLSPLDKLKLSIHAASSVADLHTIDNTPTPSIFHNDICCHQYLFQGGVFKLNDFNYARPIYKHKKTNNQCTRSSFGMAMWKGRSIEEMHSKLKPDDFQPVKPDKIDVWMMGNLIYYMLTDLYIFEKPKNLSWKDSGKELLAGRRSQYPQHVVKSKDPAHVAIKKALDMCWTQDWKERPSARSIADYLMGQLKEITGDDNPDVRVVLPERDPNQKPTDSEYKKYNVYVDRE